MRRRVVPVILLLFLVLPYITGGNLDPYDDGSARGFESPFETFTAAVDGAESDQSLYSFSSTLEPQRVLFFPDTLSNNTLDYIDAGSGTGEIGDYTKTFDVDADVHIGQAANYAYLRENWTIHDEGIDGFDYAFYCAGSSTDDDAELWIYDFVADDWEKLDDDIGLTGAVSYDWSNGTVTNPDYWDITNNVIMFMLNSTDVGTATVYNDYSEITFYHMTLADADHFAESFSDISDVTVSVGETVTTDGDLGTFHNPGDNAWDYYFWNSPSSLAVQVIEWRTHSNISSSSYEFALYSADDGGGSQLWTSGSITAPTSAGTKKYSPMVTGVESIRFATRHASSPASFIFDYLRGSKSTETGWQHDGSTIVGIGDNGNTKYDFHSSSDGDILNLTTVRNDATETDPSGDFFIYYDTTSTKTDLSITYYQFFEMRYKFDVGCSGWFYLYAGGKTTAQYMTPDDAWHTVGINLAAGTGTGLSYVRINVDYTYVLNRQRSAYVDWMKFYSIANYSITQSGTTTDDYLYVSAGTLYSHIDDGYIEANHDPAISVSDTYPVYNLTTSGTSPEFSQYVSEWSTYSDDTRGATTSGTVTDIKLKFDSTEIISEITFIEDGTAPDADIVVSPNPPDDDEQVTLSSIVFDTVEVYKVSYNAISYPAGFSDVDYEATEGQENYWSYSFSSLIAGDYCFKVIAGDGANNNTITQSNRDYATVRFTVREADININPITFVGAGEDFEDVTLSFECNRDGTYSVVEWTLSDASDAAETWTGTVIDGWNNLAWDKLDTDSNTVYFNFTITSGSLTWTFENQYQVAQTTFYVLYYNHNGPDWSEVVTVTGRITKTASYTVYIDDTEATTGTITNLDFDIEFSKILTSASREAWHDWAIKFTNGSQTCWANGTLYLWKNDPDQPPGGGGDLGGDERRTIQMWATIAAVIGIIGLGCIGLVYFKFDEVSKLQLPNYPTQPSTRDERRKQRRDEQ